MAAWLCALGHNITIAARSRKNKKADSSRECGRNYGYNTQKHAQSDLVFHLLKFQKSSQAKPSAANQACKNRACGWDCADPNYTSKENECIKCHMAS